MLASHPCMFAMLVVVMVVIMMMHSIIGAHQLEHFQLFQYLSYSGVDLLHVRMSVVHCVQSPVSTQTKLIFNIYTK